MFIFPRVIAPTVPVDDGIETITQRPADDRPSWMTKDGLHMLSNGYLLEGETPWTMYQRMSNAAAKRLGKPELATKFFSIMWKGWLGPATPVAANMGTDRGLPISCNSLEIADSLPGIWEKVGELMALASKGAGVGIYMGNIRGRGAPIGTDGSISEGVIPWAKIYDSATVATSQGKSRRGQSVFYLPVSHKDIHEFLRMRRPGGDENSRCMNTHHAVCIDDADMERLEQGDPEMVELFQEILKTRIETGEPYLFFSGNVNRKLPLGYERLGLKVKTSNLCSEITAYTDPDHSFVCCLSSMNLAKWDEWKDTKAAYYATWFLEGVMQEYIAKAQHLPGFEAAVRFAKKSSMIGLGVMGYHTLIQSKSHPFASFPARLLNKAIFKHLANESNKASKDMAEEYGEPEWCKGTGVRNTQTLTVAPTVSNSIICGDVSAGIEPLPGACYERKTAKGTLYAYNPLFTKVLQKYGKDNTETWMSITANKGSVQHLEFLSDEEREVFLTAREIDQLEIIQQAADRQVLMDLHRQGQSQSVNLYFLSDADESYVTRVHYLAWKLGLKTLYYCRSEAVSKADLPFRLQAKMDSLATGEQQECFACHG